MLKVEYDPHNDRFVRDLGCPHINCDAPLSRTPLIDSELFYCQSCGRPFEVVKLKVAKIGGAQPYAARRARSAFCTRSGKKLRKSSVLDFAGSGGGPARSGSIHDAMGALFGHPETGQEWTLERTWATDIWGSEDRSRPEESVTSLHVVRGVVVAVAASGRIALFDIDSGKPLLKRPLEWANIDLDENDPTRAIRLPPAFRSAQCVAITDRLALFRDLSPGIFPGRGGSEIHTLSPSQGSQFIGPALIAGEEHPRAVLVEGQPHGPLTPPSQTKARLFTLEGQEKASVDLDGAVRPCVYDSQSGRVLTVNALGHVLHFSPNAIADEYGKVPAAQSALPSDMLDLASGEKAHLLLAQSHGAHTEVWLADDKGGAVRVWRARLDDILSGEIFRWELLFEDLRLGQLRGFAVGEGGRARENIQGRYFVVSSEKTTAAYSRALKSPASDAVLVKQTLTPPVMNAMGFFIYDHNGLWLRGFTEWSFKDKNPERRVAPVHPEQRASFYDRTLALYGRHVFFATGGLIHAAQICE